MPNLKLETHEKEKPIILISGDKNPLIPFLFENYRSNFKVVYLSDIESDRKKDENFYRIKPESASLIKSLEEKIDYAVIFLETNRDKNLVSAILGKLTEDKTKTLILFDIYNLEHFYDTLLQCKDDPNVHFLFLGDVYAELPEFNLHSQTSKIIKNAIKNKSLTLAGNALKPIFPIYYKDAVVGIGQILFGLRLMQRFFYLFYNHPQTYISAIHIIKRVEPDLDINYQEDGKVKDTEMSFEKLQKDIRSKLATTPIFLDKYFLGFEKTLAFFQKGKAEDEEINKRPEIMEKALPKKSHIKFFGKALILACFLFIIINVIFAALGIFQLKSSLAAFKKSDYKNAYEIIGSAKIFLEITKPSVSIAAKIAQKFGDQSIDTNFETFTSSTNLLMTASKDLEIIKAFPQGIDREKLDQLVSDSLYLYFTSEEIKGRIKSQALDTLDTPDLSKMLSLAQVATEIFGFDKEKNYLLLFQNNGELRPTGGFIGSVGELKIRSGKIEGFNIQDVYEYDGRLKAHVEPHYIIRRYLQPHLYLRDSNFDYNFQNAASMSALIYSLETDRKVDGVIAVNFEAVREIIKEIGPIKLTSYNKTLDEKNTFEFLETTIDENFFPGSSQKREVLESLLSHLTLKLEQDKNSFIKAAILIPRLLSEKDMLISFNAKSVQNTFSANGYGGEYRDFRKKEQDVMDDFLGINEANIGVNKANIRVERNTEYEVSLGGKITSRVIHKVKNSGDNAYRAYIRIISPLGSDLSSVRIDGREQKITKAIVDSKIYEDKKFKPPDGLEVDNTIEDGKQVFGFIINVSPKTEQKIEVFYDNGMNPVSGSIITYSLLFIKQPGILVHPLTVRLKYDKSYAPKVVENAKLLENAITFSEALVRDKEFKIKLIRR